jgi:SAM-dependent methyltransferase
LAADKVRKQAQSMTIDPARVAFQAFAPIYDEFCGANDYEMWVGALLLELEKRGLVHGRTLDVGCGTGRAFQPLLSRGWRIVGCDLSPAMLAEARRKFDDTIPLYEADIRELPILGRFELVLALNDVVNYLIDDGDLDRAFVGIRANLAPRGLALFDTNTLATLRSSSDGKATSQDRGEWLWEGLTKDAVPGGIFDSRISGPGVETHIHRERHHTAREISEGLEAAGLELLASLGQQEIDGAVRLTEQPDEERDHKIIHICRAAAG